MKKNVFYVIALSIITTMLFAGDDSKKKKTIHFSNTSKSYDISVMNGAGDRATTRIDKAHLGDRTKRYVYPAKDLKISFNTLQGGKKLKGIIGLQAYNEWGAPAHDDMKYYSLEIKNISEKPTIQLDYNALLGYSFNADKALKLKTEKQSKIKPHIELGS
jgi:hypothetical protein